MGVQVGLPSEFISKRPVSEVAYLDRRGYRAMGSWAPWFLGRDEDVACCMLHLICKQSL